MILRKNEKYLNITIIYNNIISMSFNEDTPVFVIVKCCTNGTESIFTPTFVKFSELNSVFEAFTTNISKQFSNIHVKQSNVHVEIYQNVETTKKGWLWNTPQIKQMLIYTLSVIPLSNCPYAPPLPKFIYNSSPKCKNETDSYSESGSCTESVTETESETETGTESESESESDILPKFTIGFGYANNPFSPLSSCYW